MRRDTPHGKAVFGAAAAALMVLVVAGILITGTGGAGRTYRNPVLAEVVDLHRPKPALYHGPLGIGDPAVLLHDGVYYLYPTGDNHGYDVYISADLVSWEKGPRVFQSSAPGLWAPDVFRSAADGKFYLYYTADTRIGVAVGESPEGTFEDRGILLEHAIDAHMFLDEDGAYYLYYAEYPALKIHVQRMRSPLEKEGNPVLLLSASEPWETRLIRMAEAPWMLKHLDTYYLLYSASAADSVEYAVGYATSPSPLGPFTKHRGNPLMQKGDGVLGPGHCSVTKDIDGNLWMVYHQQKDRTRGWNRIICIDPLRIDGDGTLRISATRNRQVSAPAVQ